LAKYVLTVPKMLLMADEEGSDKVEAPAAVTENDEDKEEEDGDKDDEDDEVSASPFALLNFVGLAGRSALAGRSYGVLAMFKPRRR
jgi:hypothetical protein